MPKGLNATGNTLEEQAKPTSKVSSQSEHLAFLTGPQASQSDSNYVFTRLRSTMSTFKTRPHLAEALPLHGGVSILQPMSHSVVSVTRDTSLEILHSILFTSSSYQLVTLHIRSSCYMSSLLLYIPSLLLALLLSYYLCYQDD